MTEARRLCDVCRKEILAGEEFSYEQKGTVVYGRIGAPSSQPTGVAKGPIVHQHTACLETP